MSNFTKEMTSTFEFDGDQVAVTFSRMKQKHMLKVAPFMKTQEGGASFEETAEMIEVAGEVLPDLIKSIVGPTDAAGNPLALEDIIDEVYFMPLVAEIFGEVLQESFNVGSVKNSAASPGGTSAE